MAIGLCLLVMASLLTAECTTTPVSENQTGIHTPSREISPTITSKGLYKVTITQQNGSRYDLIRLDSDVYNPGEVIEFSLLTDIKEIQPCEGDIFSFRVFFRSPDGSWEELPGPFEAYHPYVAPQPASTAYPGMRPSVPAYRLVTTGWSPGHYKIQSDCLQASHEFLLRNLSSGNTETRN